MFGLKLQPRIKDVLILAPIPLIMLIVHPMTAWLLFVTIGFVGLHECRRIATQTRERFYTWQTRLALGLNILAAIISIYNINFALLMVVVNSVVIFKIERSHNRDILAMGQALLGMLVVLAYALRSGQIFHGEPKHGLVILGLALVISVFSDSAAYFVGKMLGRTKFAPVISPNKTWEGAIGGWIFAIIAAVIYCHFLVPEISSIHIIFQVILFWLLAFAGQMGDLGESMFKRKFNVKDSGETLRSHGGILDRFDSIGPILILLTLAIWAL